MVAVFLRHESAVFLFPGREVKRIINAGYRLNSSRYLCVSYDIRRR